MPSPRKSFLLRVDPSVLEAVQRWANDDLRSLNGQIEFVLRRALTHVGRTPVRSADTPASSGQTAAVDDETTVDGDA